MSIRSSRLAILLVGVLAVTAFACGEDREETDAGVVAKKDGGVPVPTDAGLVPGDGGTDAGTPPPATTVPVINNLDDPNHPQTGKVVSFKAIVVSPRMRISKKTNATNPADNNCLYGLFVADQNAGAEYNGLMLTSKSTVTDGNCNSDSQLNGTEGNDITIGEELVVTGFYQEYCYNQNGICVEQDAAGKGISFPQVSVNKPGDVTRSGNKPGLPASLPAAVTVAEVNSTGTATPFTMGSKWWQYRAVFVEVSNVDAGANPDTGTDYCEWTVAPAGQTTPTIRVDDALDYAPNCLHRPAAGTNLTSLSGLLYWTYGNAKILPRDVTDATPNLPE